MLPNFLISTYQKYKEDTTRLATWLVQAAQSCGYQLPQSSAINAPPKPKATGRLKGKARKQAVQEASRRTAPEDVQQESIVHKRILPLKEFESIAKHLVAQPRPELHLPVDLMTTLTRTISFRQEASAWYAGLRSPQSDSGGHRHFIKVLQNVKDILTTGLTPVTKKIAATNETKQSENNKDSSHVLNRFEHLDLEEPVLTSADEPVAKNVSATDPLAEYTPEPLVGEAEQYFALYSLFSDINNIRSFVSGLWSQYKNGDAQLIAVAIAANTAIDIVRRLEKGYLREVPSVTQIIDNLDKAYAVFCALHGKRPDQVVPGEQFNFECYDEADWFMLPTYLTLASFCDVVQPGMVPIYKPGYSRTYDPASDRAPKTARQRFEEDKVILLEALPSFCFMAKIEQNTPAEDDFTRGLRDMMHNKAIPIWLLFAAQCFLDVHALFRSNIDKCFDELSHISHAARLTVEENMDFHKNLKVMNWPKSNDEMLIQNFIDLDQRWIKHDPIHAAMKEKFKGMPIPRPFHLMKQHPLLCGLFAFTIQTNLLEAGTIFAAAWGSIIYTAHLYNAVRQEIACNIEWHDMESIIKYQKPQRIFVGDLPTTPQQYFQRFALGMGYSATMLPATRRPGVSNVSKKGPRGLEEMPELSKIFRRRHVHNNDRIDITLAEVELLLNQKYEPDNGPWEDDSSDELSDGEVVVTEIGIKPRKRLRSERRALQRRLEREKHLSYLELLLALVAGIDEELPQLTFDYFAFHRTCWRLLRQVQQSLHQDLLRYYQPGYIEKENQLSWLIGYIFMTAYMSGEAAKALGLKQPKAKIETSSKVLQKAGHVVQQFIESEQGGTQPQVVTSTVVSDDSTKP